MYFISQKLNAIIIWHHILSHPDHVYFCGDLPPPLSGLHRLTTTAAVVTLLQSLLQKLFLFLFSGSTYELATFCFKMDNTVGLGLDVPSDSLAQLTLVSTDTVCSNAPALDEMDQSGPFSLHVRTVKKIAVHSKSFVKAQHPDFSHFLPYLDSH